MINFKQFITEARMAPLYHGTAAHKLESILKDGLRPSTTQENKKLLRSKSNISAKNIDTWNKSTGHSMDHGDMRYHNSGVSFTRSKKFATSWSGMGVGYVVLEMDHQALASRYKIIPIQFFFGIGGARSKDYTGTQNEYEEFVITDRPIPNQFVKRIYYKSFLEDWASDYRLAAVIEFDDMMKKLKKQYPHIQFVNEA